MFVINKKYIPNALTWLRVLIAPLIAALVFFDNFYLTWVAFSLFIAAAFLDFFDGWLARKLNTTSGFGAMLDPIADKLLVVCVAVALAITAWIPPIHTIPIFATIIRDTLVSGLRAQSAAEGKIISVTSLTKLKTALELLAISVLLGGRIFMEIKGLQIVHFIGLGALWFSGMLSVLTGVMYFKAYLSINRTE